MNTIEELKRFLINAVPESTRQEPMRTPMGCSSYLFQEVFTDITIPCNQIRRIELSLFSTFSSQRSGEYPVDDLAKRALWDELFGEALYLLKKIERRFQLGEDIAEPLRDLINKLNY